jgi:hypothetical protein
MESCLVCGPSSKLIDKKCNKCNQKYDPQKIDLPDNVSKFTKSVNNFFFSLKDTQSFNGFLDYTNHLRQSLNISYDVSKQVHNWFENEIKKIERFSKVNLKVQSNYFPQNIQHKSFQLKISLQNLSSKELYSVTLNFNDGSEVSTSNFIKPNQNVDLTLNLNYKNFGQINYDDSSITIKNQFEDQQEFIVDAFKIEILKPKPINLADYSEQKFQPHYLDLILLPNIDLEKLNQSISSNIFHSETLITENETISSSEPQPFYANEYSSDKSSKTKERIKGNAQISKTKPKKSMKKIFWFFIIIIGFIFGLYIHDYYKPCDALVFKADYKCRNIGSCQQIYNKFETCMSKSSTSYCLSKWGKTMTVETFNEFTDIKGKLVESNSKYKVSGPNYSSRWIKASWYYFNEEIGIKEYGTDIVVGPVGSDSEITESYTDLKDFIIYDDDKDGWKLPTIWSVETACFAPKP